MFNRGVHNLSEEKGYAHWENCQFTYCISACVDIKQFTLNLKFLFYYTFWISYEEFQKIRQEAVENSVASQSFEYKRGIPTTNHKHVSLEERMKILSGCLVTYFLNKRHLTNAAHLHIVLGWRKLSFKTAALTENSLLIQKG